MSVEFSKRLQLERGLQLAISQGKILQQQWLSPFGSSLIRSFACESGLIQTWPNKVYHYTTVENLFKIVSSENGNMANCRFSTVRGMNDTNELIYGLNLVENIAGKKQYRGILKIVEYVKRRSNCYGAFCLSENSDSIPLWLIYGNRSEGVAIGFDSECLLTSNGYFVKVIYDNKTQIEFLESILGHMHNWCTLDVVNSFNEIDLSNISILVAAIALSLKDEKWKFEDEWRLVLRLNLDEIAFKQSGIYQKKDYHVQGLDNTQINSLINLSQLPNELVKNFVVENLNPLRELKFGRKVSTLTKEVLKDIISQKIDEIVEMTESECLIG